MRSTIYDLPFTDKITTDTPLKDTPLAITAQFGNQYGQSAPKGINNIALKYTVVWAPLSRTDMQTLRNVFRAVGSWGAVRWKPIEETNKLYFAMPPNESFDAKPVSAAMYECRVTLIQVFDVLPGA